MQASLLNLSTEYLSVLFQISVMEKNEKATEAGLQKLSDFQKKGVTLGLMTSFPTTQKIMNNILTINELSKYKLGSEERNNLGDKFAKEYAELYLSLYGEIAKYRYRSTEKAAQDELMLSIGQIILNMEKQQK